MLRIGSLFSGIGGLELRLEMSGLGHTVWQVEQNLFCLRVLSKHWPYSERYNDVKEAGAHNLSAVDLICGGFPCQDISSAGKGSGLAGKRSGLWFEFARIVGELRPRWVVVENVASGAKRWVDQVVGGLEQLDYQALPIPLSAADVGAPHLRRRIFVVAYTEREQLREQQGRCGRARWERAPELGDDGEKRKAANTGESRLQGPEPMPGSIARAIPAERAWADKTMPEPALCRMDDGISARMDRNRRIKALGNAVVPQCAEVIGYVIQGLKA